MFVVGLICCAKRTGAGCIYELLDNFFAVILSITVLLEIILIGGLHGFLLK